MMFEATPAWTGGNEHERLYVTKLPDTPVTPRYVSPVLTKAADDAELEQPLGDAQDQRVAPMYSTPRPSSPTPTQESIPAVFMSRYETLATLVASEVAAPVHLTGQT